ncbi:DsbA family oxidoreductase [Pseudokordiimonas caeni]|uniref:DsbA family oxidoreductase n=1 Tax=Pseudokordiimonas caeni TaxID=2997908 RepID=UPI002810F406|nr:DsbA family oxidoreductase [Pseudokordiimonas caeni]
MLIDTVIDVVCPWCFVGKRELDLAVAARPAAVTGVRWRPYQLSAETPAEGVDRATYYAQKFGDSPQFQQARKHLIARGEALGIAFDFERPARIANTLDAHRLIRWALAPGKQDLVVEGLMRAYFEEGAFLGDRELLADIAERAGMDHTLVTDLLASDADKDAVQAEVAEAHRMGVQGVPFFIFDGRFAVSGAQDHGELVKVIDHAQATAAAGA